MWEEKNSLSKQFLRILLVCFWFGEKLEKVPTQTPFIPRITLATAHSTLACGQIKSLPGHATLRLLSYDQTICWVNVKTFLKLETLILECRITACVVNLHILTRQGQNICTFGRLRWCNKIVRIIFTPSMIYKYRLVCGQRKVMEGHLESWHVLVFKKAIKYLWFGLCRVNHRVISAPQIIMGPTVTFKEKEAGLSDLKHMQLLWLNLTVQLLHAVLTCVLVNKVIPIELQWSGLWTL